MKKIIRNIFCAVLAVLLILGLLLPAFAEEVEDVSGEGDGVACGEALSWFFEDGTLTISGSGDMYDFEKEAPWADFKDSITRVVLTGGVTKVGGHAFENYDKITSVDFGDSLVRLGERAFANCDGLTTITLPKTFKSFEEECLYTCNNLKEVHCEGVFPHFRQNCLWNTYCKIYFPADAPWSVLLIQQLEEAFQGRIEFLASDGSDPYTPTEATEETTEATAEPETTEAPTTEETTEPTTEPETTEAPTTEEVTTEPETEEPETTKETFLMGTVPPTETEAPSVRRTSGITIGLAIVVGTLALIAAAALLFSYTNRRRYDD